MSVRAITGVSSDVRMLRVGSVAAVQKDTHSTSSGTSVSVSTYTHVSIIVVSIHIFTGCLEDKWAQNCDQTHWAHGAYMGGAGLPVSEWHVITVYIMLLTFPVLQMTMSAWTRAAVVQLLVSTHWAVLSVAVHLASPLTPCPLAVRTWTSACPSWAPADTAAQTHRVDSCADVLRDITEQDRGEMYTK